MYIRILFLFLFILSSMSVLAQKKSDKPRAGEGIQTFLQRNKCTGNDQHKKFIELNKGKFGKNNALILGRTYLLPTDSKNKTKTTSSDKTDKRAQGSKKIGSKKKEPLFGKKYAEYTVKSNRLGGASFYLSSGHGGPDPGSIGKVDGREIYEDEYAYDITLRLARCLLEEGATVYMIIQDPKDGIRDDMFLANSKNETCMGKPIPLGQKARLKQRVDKINSLSEKSNQSYKRAVFIHLDSRSQKQKLDVFFYYHANSKAGKKLANTMRETFRDQYNLHQKNRGFTGTVSSRSLYVLDNSIPVGLFVELGNIQNKYDQKRFINPQNREALAKWLCKGLIRDYNDSRKK